MAKPRRVVFSFDDRSLESVHKMAAQGRSPSHINHCPGCTCQPEEVTEIKIKNPQTGEERIVVVPTWLAQNRR